MLRKLVAAALAAAALLALAPAAALAHTGDFSAFYPYHKTIQAGPYSLDVHVGDWPMLATKWTDLVVRLDGGYQYSQVQIHLHMLPGPGVKAREKDDLLLSHDEFPGQPVWGGRRWPVPAAGQWTWEFVVDGPRGQGVARMGPFTVLPAPGIPAWLGWLIGFVPLYGLLWFALRQHFALRRRTAVAAAA